MKRALLLFAVLLTGCGLDGEDICEDLAECEDIDFDRCVKDSELVEARVDSEGCHEAYDDYLDCLNADVCDWRDCSASRGRVEACTGPFPTD